LKKGEERIEPIVAKRGERCRRGVGAGPLLILAKEYELGIQMVRAAALLDIRNDAIGGYAIGFPEIQNDSQQLSPGGS
jgi:hypothetical protein